MKNAWWLTLNILKVSFRKKSTLITFFVLPIVGIMLSIGLYSNTGLGSGKIGLVDRDRSLFSRDLVQSLKNEGKFKINPADERNIENDITSGKVDCVLTIPRGFGTNIYTSRSLEVRIVSLKGDAVTAWIKNYLNNYIQGLRDIGEASGGSSDMFMQIYQHYRQRRFPLKVITIRDETRNKSMSTQSFGFLIMFMLVGVGNSVEMILREKRSRTYYRICSSPVNARTYIIGNVLANLVIVIIQVLLVLLVMKLIGMETYIPFMELFAILVFFGLTAIGLGLLIVAFSNDTGQAGILQNLIITPSCFLAGCFWPVEIMPGALQRIADFMPQKWALAAIQKLQQGVGFDKVLTHIGIIIAFALAFYLIAAYRFSRSEDVRTFV